MAAADITTIMQAVTTFGNWILFFYLYVQKDKQLDAARNEHREDLRSIAQLDPPPPRYRNPGAYQPPQTTPENPLQREKAL